MAPENRVNLIEEFENQEDNDFIILTTFSFDPPFFDSYLLDKIRRNNPYAEIFVLVDSTVYQSKYDEFTSQTGTSYHLLPVNMERGLFHPKVHMFLSEQHQEANIYVCSSNLTLQGFTNNIESVVSHKYSLEDGVYDSVESVVGFFERISESLVNDIEYQEYLEDIRESSLLSGKLLEEPSARFLSNHDTPILDEFIGEIEGKEFDELFLSAPFISEKPVVLSKIIEVAQVDNVTLALQRDNHNLETVDHYRDFCDTHGIEFELRELVSDEDRFLHAKMVALKGEERFSLVGSPNLTRSALIETWSSGNSECSVFLKNTELDILTEFQHQAVDEEGQFLSQRIDDSRKGNTPVLHIHSVEFTEVTRELEIKTENRKGEGEIQIKTRNPENQITDSINLSRNRSVFSIDEGVPTEIEVRFKDEIGRRRVFFDENIFQKRTKRTSVSLQEISESLDQRPDFRVDDLVAVFTNLGLSVNREEKETSSTGSSTGSGEDVKGGEKFLPPSRGRGGGSGVDSVLRKLTQLYDAVRTRKQREQQLEDTYSGESDEAHLEEYQSSVEEITTGGKIDSRIKKLIRRSNELLLEKSADSENPIELWLDAQHFLIMSFLTFFGYLNFSEDVFSYLEDYLEENLERFEDIDWTDVEFSADVKRRFFTYLVIYNFVNRRLDREDFVPMAGKHLLMRHLYSYDDLISKEVYYQIRETTEGFLESKMEEPRFDLREFHKVYADMAGGSVGPKTMKDDLTGLCKSMAAESDEDFIEVQALFLRGRVDNWSITRKLQNRVEEIHDAKSETAQEAINYLLDVETRYR